MQCSGSRTAYQQKSKVKTNCPAKRREDTYYGREVSHRNRLSCKLFWFKLQLVYNKLNDVLYIMYRMDEYEEATRKCERLTQKITDKEDHIKTLNERLYLVTCYTHITF